ncbi:ABC transporter ATP-binding protein [Mesorhizobium sp. 1B3]|uniref:ABC transporter ATP-binding protein n=1 Tax=Mesorhizobium sp. 1B3 TaxID=3243599 RepID=UPI003D99636A
MAAVRSVSLSLREGSLTSLLGPSGCGKTTLLRLIAGLETVSTGEIKIKGRPVGKVPIHKRNIGLVFQNYALFPHKTIGENIAFGLKHRGIDKASAMQKVRQALDMVRLPGIEQRYPNQLSGGQQQRVALARAVVFEPDVLLLDEPLSALDANLREEMRVEIKLIQKALGVTTILVTHDQQEALAMSDEIVVMNQGNVQQVGDPKAVYRFPQNRFVAGFLGQANVLPCTVVETAADGSGHWLVRVDNGTSLLGISGGPREQAIPKAGHRADLVIRGSDVELLAKSADSGRPERNGFEGTVIDASYLGDDAHYLVESNGIKFKAVIRLTYATAGEADDVLAPGARVFVSIPPRACAIISAG